jgi:hypothetical protein
MIDIALVQCLYSVFNHELRRNIMSERLMAWLSVLTTRLIGRNTPWRSRGQLLIETEDFSSGP